MNRARDPGSAQARSSSSEHPPQNGTLQEKQAEPVLGSDANTADIAGTVLDTNDDPVPGASVNLRGGGPINSRTVKAGGNGFFEFRNLGAGVTYRISVSAPGFSRWSLGAIVLTPGQHLFLAKVTLQLKTVMTSVTVTPETTQQIATRQVTVELQQRVLGVIPNFYTVFVPNPAPLTAKLKFRLALRESVDPITFLGAGMRAGINQATDQPDFVLGAKGYGQRLGAVYADDVTNNFFGDAILPSLLHQDPRYYYQATGSIRSRALYAVSRAFITKGDDGRQEPNYSSIGGDLISGGISNLYYPESNRGVNLVWQNTLINTGERALGDLLKQFVLPRFTRDTRDRSASPDDGIGSH